MEKYILPQIKKYNNIEELIKNDNNIYTRQDLSIDELLQDDFVCILGEPGIGKSRLVKEIKNIRPESCADYPASKFNSSISPKESDEYCIIDALDEVEGDNFYSTLQSIIQFKDKYPKVKVFFTCRKHYVTSNASLFGICQGLVYIELCKLRDIDVKYLIDKDINNNSALKNLLSIPRYLTYYLQYKNNNIELSNIGELFNYIIEKSIQEALNNNSDQSTNKNLNVLIRRILEKIAFIMEIGRKDEISKEDLYTILDGIRGNMAQILLSTFNILYLESRILKETNNTLQFENSEIQEYLASKELCRQDNIESVFYDVAVQKDLKHIYQNWFDVIPHISYEKDNIQTFVNLIRLIISYESNLETEKFDSLLRYANPEKFSQKEKEILFQIILNHYLKTPTYIHWRNEILRVIQGCYTSNSIAKLIQLDENLNNIQLSNITDILGVIIKEDILDEEVIIHWKDVAQKLLNSDDEDKKIAALELYKSLKDKDTIIHLANEYGCFSQKVKERYCNITGYDCYTDEKVVDCWLESCFQRNPYAINAVLNITDPLIISYAYKKIIEKDKLPEFFNKTGSLIVCYDTYLVEQFEIIWKYGNREDKQVFAKVIAHSINEDIITTYNKLNVAAKKILLNKETGKILIDVWKNSYSLAYHIQQAFSDKDLIDKDLLSALDELLPDTEKNFILRDLVFKIWKDEDKRDSISQYIELYEKTFRQWEINTNTNSTDFKDAKVHPEMNDGPTTSQIDDFFNKIDLDKTTTTRDGDQFSISRTLYLIPYYVKRLHDFDAKDILIKHRIILAKSLPLICSTWNQNRKEIKSIYKEVIGEINEKEKEELISWWKSRIDDFLKINPDDVFDCIREYGLNGLSYMLVDYINDYISNQDLRNYHIASKALSLISDNYYKWDIKNYQLLFNQLTDDSLDSLKVQCNFILIEKYQDLEATKWRFEYIKKHDITIHHDSDEYGARAISDWENEITGPNPILFRCFMNINENQFIIEQMFDLFDYDLEKSVEPHKQDYSNYLLNQIYIYFSRLNDVTYLLTLRRKVESFNAKSVSYLANIVMNKFEMIFMQGECISIDKALKKYNKCIDESYLPIRNDEDLRRYFTRIHEEVQKEIVDNGVYSIVRKEDLSEDFIQRTIKDIIITKCCKIGLKEIQIDREVALQDNKRTDLLVRYGL